MFPLNNRNNSIGWNPPYCVYTVLRKFSNILCSSIHYSFIHSLYTFISNFWVEGENNACHLHFILNNQTVHLFFILTQTYIYIKHTELATSDPPPCLDINFHISLLSFHIQYFCCETIKQKFQVANFIFCVLGVDIKLIFQILSSDCC